MIVPSVEPEGAERVCVAGEDATLIVWSPDYDGGGKACVRFDDGRDAIAVLSALTYRFVEAPAQTEEPASGRAQRTACRDSGGLI